MTVDWLGAAAVGLFAAGAAAAVWGAVEGLLLRHKVDRLSREVSRLLSSSQAALDAASRVGGTGTVARDGHSGRMPEVVPMWDAGANTLEVAAVRQMSKQEAMDVARAAGVTEDEMRDDPEFGLLISPEGARKLAAMAPDSAGKLELLAHLRNLEAGRGDGA